MSQQNFQKPSLNHQQHIELLKNRGLIIADNALAKHYLEYVGYYRLSGFFRSFYTQANNPNHNFKTNTAFVDTVNLYEFDTELRSILLSGIERLEVAVRAVINNVMAEKYGSHWYLEQKLFIKEFNHQRFLRLIEKETQYHDKGGNNPIFQSYYKKYYTPELPACWMLGEILSFGAWSKVFFNLRHGVDKLAIAKKFNMPHYKVLQSWLHASCFTRNLCAHHAMICFKNFHITPIKPVNWASNEQKIFDKQHTVFLQATIVQFLLKSASPNTKLAPLFTKLFNQYPSISIAKMGFDAGWENHEVWQ